MICRFEFMGWDLAREFLENGRFLFYSPNVTLAKFDRIIFVHLLKRICHSDCVIGIDSYLELEKL